MRILHTSDWHIGRSFHGYSTMDALAEVLTALVAQVREHQVDVVLVAGDVFDSATPPAAAYTVLSDALVALHDTGATVILTSGNHDSAARLGFQARLLRDGIHVLTDPRGIGTPVTVTDEDGPVDFYGIPYLEPVLVRQHWPEVPAEQLRTQAQALEHAMGIVRESMAARPGRAVAIAHTFAAGVSATEGLEREVRHSAALRQGGVDVVPLSTFDGPHYVALGHIHGRQEISERVRYSGAPLHYSFGEQHKPRGSWLVELDRDGAVAAEWCELPVPRRLATLTGTLAELLSPELAQPHREHWVCAVYTDTLPQTEPMRRLKEVYPYCAMVQHEPATRGARPVGSYAERARVTLSDEERIDAFLGHVREGQGTDPSEQDLLAQVLADVRADAGVRA